MSKRKICIISSSRADYNHLFPIMSEIKSSKEFDLQVVVTGMHLQKNYGYTYKEILEDGFKIDKKIYTHQQGTLKKDIIKSMSEQLIKTYYAINQLDPDVLIILGDRYDIYPIAIVGQIIQKPIIHIHGGEITHGCIDDSIRHSITKLSHVHFVATQEFQNRVIQLGEEKKNIYNIGSLGIQSIIKIPRMTKNEVFKKLKLDAKEKYFMVCLHPETVNENNSCMTDNLLRCLGKIEDHNFIFTSPNSDHGGDLMYKKILNFCKNNNKAFFSKSLGKKLFINALRFSSGIIGNSSSGIIEAPYLKINTVNIGSRQSGRPLADSIINSNYSKNSINGAIKKLMKTCKTKSIVYKNKSPLKDIIKILKNLDLKKTLIKKFSDIR